MRKRSNSNVADVVVTDYAFECFLVPDVLIYFVRQWLVVERSFVPIVLLSGIDRHLDNARSFVDEFIVVDDF